MADQLPVQPPPGPCPKCGTPNAFEAHNPDYIERSWTNRKGDEYFEEKLAWPCRRCGYHKETPVLG